jgi:hypothetical protein
MMNIINGVLPDFKEILKSIEHEIQRMKVVVADLSKLKQRKSIENRSKFIISAESIDEGVTWIENVLNFCDEKQGTPFQKCEKAFRKSILECRWEVLLL